MALYKQYAQAAAYSGYTVKVVYSDVAGGYGGWFLVHVKGPRVELADPDSDPTDGADTSALIASGGLESGDAKTDLTGSPRQRTGGAVIEQVNARLFAMFGHGNSAKWTATIVQDVTPAVISDDWGTP